MTQYKGIKLNTALWLLFAAVIIYSFADLADFVIYLLMGTTLIGAVSAWIKISAFLPVIIYAFSGKEKIFSLSERKPLKTDIFLSALGGIFAAVALGVLYNYLYNYLGIVTVMSTDDIQSYFTSYSSSPLSVIMVCAALPFIKETVFRGVLQNGAEIRSGSIAIAIAAVMGGLFCDNIPSFLITVLAGIFSGYIFYKTRSIINAIVFQGVLSLMVFSGISDFVINLPWRLETVSWMSFYYQSPVYMLYTIGMGIACAAALFAVLRLIYSGSKNLPLRQNAAEQNDRKYIVPLILCVIFLCIRFLANTAFGF